MLQKLKKKIKGNLKRHPLLKNPTINLNSIDEPLQTPFKSHFIIDNQSILNNSAKICLEKWGCRNPIFYNYDQSYLDNLSRSFNFYTGSPKVKNFNDVIYMPQYRCLYSSNGLRINDCILFRGADQTDIITNAPDKIIPPKQLKKISQRFIYAGDVIDHYGHFLVESISRLWYIIKEQNYPVICHIIGKNNMIGNIKNKKSNNRFIDIFFESINLDKYQFIAFNEPVLLQEVTIPCQSLVDRCEGFEVHKLIPENVAKMLLPQKMEKTGQPLYFSRTKLGRNVRLVINESKLEERLSNLGFAIVYPEKLSLRQQIHLVNKHEVIIGTKGSALHNIIFDISDQRNLVYLGSPFINTNYLLFDAIKSFNSVYISALQTEKNFLKNTNKRNAILNLDIALNALKDIGLI